MQDSSSRAADAFPPFPFASRPVPGTTGPFDFEAWKRDPTEPLILKGALAAWPLYQRLKTCGTDDARLDYLSATFGNNVVGYTRVPARDPYMGYDGAGTQNFKYAPNSCKLSEFCEMMRAGLRDPDADVLYARGGANSVRTWPEFSRAIRPVPFLRGMTPNGEGIWLGNGRHTTYLHQDAHFNFFSMVTGIKRVLLYPLEAIADLYPTPFYGGIAGTTSSYVRPGAPDAQQFPRFAAAARHAWVAHIEDGDLLCLPPCWWHHVEAAPGVNLMINTFVWALPPRQEYRFEVMMRKGISAALGLSKEELAGIRDHLYHASNGRPPLEPIRSEAARALARQLSRFLQPDIPAYWQKIARCYYDHYIFQLNGHPVSAHPERHARWASDEALLSQRLRQWYRFTRGVTQMKWRCRRAQGIVP
jgi:hypothetical protein